MDYVKNQKEAIAIVKQMVADGQVAQDIAEKYFPELKESEDEKIRKELIEFVKSRGGFKQEYIAWLEKQGEHANFCNKIQIGDKVTRNQDGVLVNLSQLNRVSKKDEKQGEQKPADKVESFDEYGGLTDFERTLTDICIGWIGQELGWKQYIKDNADVLLKIAIKKFNSVQDAPFEQKPAWSEEDEKELGRVIYMMEQLDLTESWSDCYAFLNSIKDRVQPQQEWSEEDKGRLDIIFERIERGLIVDKDDIDRLKSIKDRVQLKQDWSKEDERLCQCLIKDQEEALDNVRNDKYGHSEIISDLKEMYNERIDWLKSLKERCNWKPSDEQIKALERECMAHSNYDLCRLCEQLKKLREEDV